MNTPRALSKTLVALVLALAGCVSCNLTNPPPPPPNGGPEFLYSAPLSDLSNTSLAAKIDPSTGGFSSVFVNVVPFFCSGGVAAVDGQFLYMSLPTTTCGSGGLIIGYSIDPTSGRPTPLAGSPFSVGLGISPAGMAMVPSSYLLYVADAGTIDAFTVEPTAGVLAPISGSPFASGDNLQLVVDPSGRFLYASDDGVPDGVFAFAIDSGGALTPVPGSPFQIPGQSGNSQPYGIVDTGKFVYTALYATNQIAAFSIDSATGALTSVPGSPFPTGANPVVLALANNFLYGVNGQDGSISGYTINPATGGLTPIPGSPFISDSATIAADLSGKYLYVSTSVGIESLNINPTTGALTLGEAGVSNDGGLWLTVAQLPSTPAQKVDAMDETMSSRR